VSFWHSEAVDASWKLLQELRQRHSFVLIGGWAVWLYTRALKSKDIDMLVDFEELSRMRRDLPIAKNDRLRKYEYRRGMVDVDIYVPHYSDLGLPVEYLMAETRIVEGFRVPEPELLLILKQKAAAGRVGSVKGEKDRIDIMALLASGAVDLGKYSRTCRERGLAGLPERLGRMIEESRTEFEVLGIRDLRKVKLLKARLLRELKGQ